MSDERTWYGRRIYTPADLSEMHAKIRLAKEAREFARALRAGKSMGFRKQVGR